MDYSQIGMLFGAYLLPGVVVAFPAGLLGQRFRDKTLGLAGLALMVISGVALSVRDGFMVALVARTLGGIGATIVVLVATKMTTDWFDRREIVLAMSILQMSWPFGAMLALPIQAYLAQVWGWPAVMISGALCAGRCSARLRLFRAGAAAVPADSRLAARNSPVPFCLPVTIAGHDLGRDEPRLHPVLQLRAVADWWRRDPRRPRLRRSPALRSGSRSWPSHRAAISFTARAGRSRRSSVCALIAASALTLFVAGIHPTIFCLIFGVAVGPCRGRSFRFRQRCSMRATAPSDLACSTPASTS